MTVRCFKKLVQEKKLQIICYLFFFFCLCFFLLFAVAFIIINIIWNKTSSQPKDVCEWIGESDEYIHVRIHIMRIAWTFVFHLLFSYLVIVFYAFGFVLIAYWITKSD